MSGLRRTLVIFVKTLFCFFHHLFYKLRQVSFAYLFEVFSLYLQRQEIAAEITKSGFFFNLKKIRKISIVFVT